MGYEELKKYNSFKQNSFVKNEHSKESDLSAAEEQKNISSTSLLKGQNKHLYGELMQAQREIKELREDIASLFQLFTENSDEQLSEQEAREVYMKFKVDPRHLINRKQKK